MMHENIVIRMQWASLFYRRVFSTQNLSVDGGYDIKIILEGGEQLFLEYLSPGWVEFTLFLLSLPIPGEGVEGQTFRLRLARRTLQRAFKKTSPPDFLSGIHLNKNDHFHPNFIIHRFIPINLVK